jgi:GxxExxY protein
MEIIHRELTERIINIFYIVYNQLGYGFLEKVYQNAMLIELTKKGFECVSQKRIMVYYQGIPVGEYYSDIVVNDSVILELKASEVLVYENECQLINYLRATEIEVGLLLNFGIKHEFRRKLFTNDRKKSVNIRINPYHPCSIKRK